MNAINVARDVLKEAFASKFMIGLFIMIALFLLGLIFSLDLDVVDGALAGGRLFGFGGGGNKAIVPVDVVLRPVFQGLAYATFYGGLLFGIVATADIAPRMLQPGRVESLLAMPVRRVELVVGIYLGVCAICVMATSVAVGGVSLVLFIKAEMVTVAPVAGAAMAMLGFCAIYGVMLAVGTVFRSAAMSAGSGLGIYLLGIVMGQKNQLLSLFSSKVVRTLVDVVTTPLPNLMALADLGGGVAGGEKIAFAAAMPLIGGTLAFAAFGVVIACMVVQSKDY
jgi:Cu-processing system permease protein